MQKDNNTRKYNYKKCEKGLIYLILLFFVSNTYSQKKFTNSIESESEQIVISFELIDHIELISTDEHKTVSIISESEDESAPDIFIEDNNGVLLIKGSTASLIDNNESNKFCVIQPIYTSHKIKIPEDKKVSVIFTEGNFYLNHFKGSLNLTLNDGVVKLNGFRGFINLKIGGGNVYCDDLENMHVDVKSNTGSVAAVFVKNQDQNKELNYLLGAHKNALKIRSISANIHLKAK